MATFKKHAYFLGKKNGKSYMLPCYSSLEEAQARVREIFMIPPQTNVQLSLYVSSLNVMVEIHKDTWPHLAENESIFIVEKPKLANTDVQYQSLAFTPQQAQVQAATYPPHPALANTWSLNGNQQPFSSTVPRNFIVNPTQAMPTAMWTFSVNPNPSQPSHASMGSRNNSGQAAPQRKRGRPRKYPLPAAPVSNLPNGQFVGLDRTNSLEVQNSLIFGRTSQPRPSLSNKHPNSNLPTPAWTLESNTNGPSPRRPTSTSTHPTRTLESRKRPISLSSSSDGNEDDNEENPGISSSDGDDDSDSASGRPNVKRGRGRPRKVPFGPQLPPPPTFKRPRGRPRKTAKIDTTQGAHAQSPPSNNPSFQGPENPLVHTSG